MRPADLPELRASLFDWYMEHGRSYFAACVSTGAQAVYTPPDYDYLSGSWIAETEVARTAKADLFWVSREMTELCVAAARTMPDLSLSPDDMPSPYGLIYFDGLGGLREFPATAMSWGPCPDKAASHSLKGPGVWLSCYIDPRACSGDEKEELQSMSLPVPPLFYCGESLVAYGRRGEGDVGYAMKGGEFVAEANNDRLIGRATSIVVVKAAWLLMQQPLAQISRVDPDRATRKRLRRAGQDPTPTRVIELRHPKSSGAHGDGSREFHHQWIVRGHWRQQWYPTREVHRPVWIAPHIKGPEGAPLIGGEKVYAWKR